MPDTVIVGVTVGEPVTVMLRVGVLVALTVCVTVGLRLAEVDRLPVTLPVEEPVSVARAERVGEAVKDSVAVADTVGDCECEDVSENDPLGVSVPARVTVALPVELAE